MLKDDIHEVLTLQAQYSSENTDEMKRRGKIIRSLIPQGIAESRVELAAACGIKPSDLLVEGRDATGRKAKVPWVRFASRESSPRATGGWYVVWLHRRDGAGVYLALAHGSTNYRDGSLVARSDAELAERMAWSRAALSEQLSQAPLLRSKVDLATRTALALSYEKSCVAAFYYPRDSIPEDDSLRSDMKFMADLLGRLYEAQRLGKSPLSQNPNVAEAEAVAALISKPLRKGNGQGFALTVCERKAIELRAMVLAIAHLQKEGFVVKDVSAKESYDLLATRNGETIKVEVKGTTGSAQEILLTRNEVELHKASFPNNALIVVHSMSLSRSEIPAATGGTLEARQPWSLDPSRLSGISYSYRLA